MGKRASETREQYRERHREVMRAWRAANASRVRDYNRRYYAANLDEKREASRRWRAANASKVRDYDRARYGADFERERRDRNRPYQRAYRERKKAELSETQLVAFMKAATKKLNQKGKKK